VIDIDRKEGPLLGSTFCRMQSGGRILVASPSRVGIQAILSQPWEPWLMSLSGSDILQAQPGRDVSHTRLVAEQVLATLPECVEDIASFDELVSQDSDLPWVLASSVSSGSFEVVAFAPPGLKAFRGHFPGQPVVPGALLLNWVGYWIKTRLGDKRPLLELNQSKFSKVVQPGEVIAFAGSTSESEIRFSLCSYKGTHASGIFRFRDVP